MPQLNANIPYIQCYVREAFLFGDMGMQSLRPCYIFGVKAQLNRPFGFHCQLDNGAVFWGLPISAFVKPGFQPLSEDESVRLQLLQYWNCQSNDITVTAFAYLQGYTVDCRNRQGDWMRGKYLFTIDDYYADLNALPTGYAADTDSKCFHVIELDNGNYCAYPNNYLRWINANFVEPYNLKDPPHYKPYQLNLSCEP